MNRVSGKRRVRGYPYSLDWALSFYRGRGQGHRYLPILDVGSFAELPFVVKARLGARPVLLAGACRSGWEEAEEAMSSPSLIGDAEPLLGSEGGALLPGSDVEVH